MSPQCSSKWISIFFAWLHFSLLFPLELTNLCSKTPVLLSVSCLKTALVAFEPECVILARIVGQSRANFWLYHYFYIYIIFYFKMILSSWLPLIFQNMKPSPIVPFIVFTIHTYFIKPSSIYPDIQKMCRLLLGSE